MMIAVPVDLLGKIIKGGEGGGGIKAPHTYSNAIPLFYQLNDNSLGLLDGHALLITNNSASLRLEQQRAVAGAFRQSMPAGVRNRHCRLLEEAPIVSLKPWSRNANFSQLPFNKETALRS